MQVLSVTVHKERQTPLAFRVRASAVIEANDLSLHKEDVGCWVSSKTLTTSSVSQAAISQIQSRERSKYLNSIASGVNPFSLVSPPNFHDYTTLLISVIRECLSIEDPKSDLSYNGASMLNTVNDARFLKLFPSITQGKLDTIRSSISSILTARTSLSSYVTVDV